MKLHEQITESKRTDLEILEYIQNRLTYLCSTKFHTDTTIQVNEVIEMLKNIRANLENKN